MVCLNFESEIILLVLAQMLTFTISVAKVHTSDPPSGHPSGWRVRPRFNLPLPPPPFPSQPSSFPFDLFLSRSLKLEHELGGAQPRKPSNPLTQFLERNGRKCSIIPKTPPTLEPHRPNNNNNGNSNGNSNTHTHKHHNSSKPIEFYVEPSVHALPFSPLPLPFTFHWPHLLPSPNPSPPIPTTTTTTAARPSHWIRLPATKATNPTTAIPAAVPNSGPECQRLVELPNPAKPVALPVHFSAEPISATTAAAAVRGHEATAAGDAWECEFWWVWWDSAADPTTAAAAAAAIGYWRELVAVNADRAERPPAHVVWRSRCGGGSAVQLAVPVVGLRKKLNYHWTLISSSQCL